MLQVVHLQFVLSIPVLYAAFLQFSEPEDQYRRLIDVFLAVLMAGWAGCFAAYILIHGPAASLKERIVTGYRSLLGNLSFLVISNVVLTLSFVALCSLLLSFRQVEVVSDTQVDVLLNDDPGRIEHLRTLKANEVTRVRMPVGRRHLVFENPVTKVPIDAVVVEIPFFWKSLNRISVHKTSEREYAPIH